MISVPFTLFKQTYEILRYLKLWRFLAKTQSAHISANIREKTSKCWHTPLIVNTNSSSKSLIWEVRASCLTEIPLATNQAMWYSRPCVSMKNFQFYLKKVPFMEITNGLYKLFSDLSKSIPPGVTSSKRCNHVPTMSHHGLLYHMAWYVA